ncbi:MAG: hypothetical protein HOM96_00205 [Rickettsiales bacterium]|jgi:hypothetical protein|nr:hypothetical protein [Rickettsiales bacterium]
MKERRIKFILDSNIFDKLNELENINFLKKVHIYSTHIQKDEILKIEESVKTNPDMDVDTKMRKLQKMISMIKIIDDNTIVIPTEAEVLELSGWSQAKWTREEDEDLLSYFKQKCSRKSTDMLIAITAIKNKFTLVTEDQSLRTAVLNQNGKCWNFRRFLNYAE